MARTGRLIVFEGSEGAGKTTQLKLLADRLRENGTDVLAVREPGGTALGNSIRNLLLDPAQHIAPAAEALLFMASRAQLVQDEIDPALARGVVVLMDRFFLSTYAYQIGGRQLSEDAVRAANSLAIGELKPDLTLVLDVPSAEGMNRAAARGQQDRIERLGDEFHSRVERAFAIFARTDWQASHPECGPIVTIDGRGSPAEVHRRVISVLADRFPERFGNLMEGTTN